MTTDTQPVMGGLERARSIEQSAEARAQQAKEKAYRDHWDEALGQLAKKFPEGLVFLCVVAPNRLEIHRGTFSDIVGLAASYAECVRETKEALTKQYGADSWPPIERTLAGYGATEPTLEDSFIIETERAYQFTCWMFPDLEDWLREHARR